MHSYCGYTPEALTGLQFFQVQKHQISIVLAQGINITRYASAISKYDFGLIKCFAKNGGYMYVFVSIKFLIQSTVDNSNLTKLFLYLKNN